MGDKIAGFIAPASRRLSPPTKVAEFVAEIFGPSRPEAEALFAHEPGVANARRREVVTIAALAADSAGVAPQRITMKLLRRIILECGYEEDDTMAKRWAGLLANAANSESSVSVLPLFPHILSMMTPDEAVTLECIHQLEKHGIANGVSIAELDERGSVHGTPLHLAVSGLEAHNVIQLLPQIRPRVTQPPGGRNTMSTHQPGWRVTEIGVHFLKACALPPTN